MACSAGYPDKPCPFGFEGKCTRKSCGPCKFFVPPKHILAWCMLWDKERKLCQLPKSACASCPMKAGRLPGRPSDGPHDLQTKKGARLYMRDWTAKHPEWKEYQEKWRREHPDYWREYYARNRQRILEQQRKARQRRESNQG